MKAVVAVLLLAAVASAITNDQLYEKYAEWSARYHKEYDALEHIQRFENFKANYHLVRHLNRQNRGHFALNEFADLSQEEFEARYLRPIAIPNRRFFKEFIVPNKQYPETKDWRDEGAVNAIRNQGSCGSCWAFSAVANMEGVYFVKHGELPSLSEQQLVDCEHDCMIYHGSKSCDAGCNGGLMPNAFTYAAREGMETEAQYPYKGKASTCQYSAAKATYHFTNWTMVGANEPAMIAALNEMGPLSVAVCASSWSYYSGGIYNSSCGTSLNHGVALVGYGADNGKQYWIIRNSWGTSWGISGYMKLARGEGTGTTGKCGVNTFVCSITI